MIISLYHSIYNYYVLIIIMHRHTFVTFYKDDAVQTIKK